jgi:heme exporter protein D
MSGHWPYIIAAYTICFVLFALDWFASVFELKNLKRDTAMRLRRDESRSEASNKATVRDQSSVDNLVDRTNE